MGIQTMFDERRAQLQFIKPIRNVENWVKGLLLRAFPFLVIRPCAICIGAQKAGTTALYHYLGLHPGVAPTKVKEIDFFNSDIRYSQGIRFYHSSFPIKTPANIGKLTFDITPGYMGGAERAARRIHDYNPKIRLIALLRNPSTRAHSAWQMYRRYCAKNRDWFWKWVQARGNYSQPKDLFVRRSSRFGTSFQEDICEEIEVIRSDQIIEMPILLLGIYERFLKHYFHYFERDQILIISSEDFRQDTERQMQQIEEFIGLKPHSWSQDTLKPRFVGDYNEQISHEESMLLKSFYRDHNLALFDLVQHEFQWD